MSSIPAPDRALDTAVVAAREREDAVVGNVILRHRLLSRVVHWSVALTFFLSLVTGFPIWLPYFTWMADLVGGLAVCRWLHPWAGVAFVLLSAAQFVVWIDDMRLEESDRGWFGPKLWTYLKYGGDDSDVGKYNGGQKLFFFAVSLGALGVLVTGLVMWFPLAFSKLIHEAAILLHDVTFILFVAAIIWHVYLGTAAEPGTFGSMVRGTVTKSWARLHHPRWYREVTGDRRGAGGLRAPTSGTPHASSSRGSNPP